jgi:hypothetical protein
MSFSRKVWCSARRLVQCPQITPAFGDQQAAAGLTIKAMDQLEIGAIPACGPHGLNDAERQAAAAVHGHARRLVQDDQLPILKDNALHQEIAGCLARLVGRTGCVDADRWNAHLVPGLDAVGLFDPALVDPDLAPANEPVNAAARQALQVRHQPIIDALTGFVLADVDVADAGPLAGIFLAQINYHFSGLCENLKI